MMMRPISVPSVGKMVVKNTCSFDSILSFLATSAADSLEFRNCIQSLPTINLTAKFIKNMFSQSDTKKIHYDRIQLLLQLFPNKIQLSLDGLRTIDMMITVASTVVEKLMEDTPSFIRTTQCINNFCSVQHYDCKLTIFSLNN